MSFESTNNEITRYGALFSVRAPACDTTGQRSWVAPQDAHTCSFLREGPLRSIQVGDERFILRDRKGFRYLTVLLSKPYQFVSAVDLKAREDGRDPREFSGSRGKMMTRECLEELRARYQSLREDLEEAASSGNAARQELIAHEISRIAEECNRTVGCRDAPRECTDAEKVRLSVTNAVRRALWSIGIVAPLLKQYFKRTIVTGHLLMFRPLANETWVV